MKIKDITEGTRCWKGYKKKGMKTMFGKRVPNCVKNEDVTKGNFGGRTGVPQLPYEEVLDAISSWEYGDTPIELSNGYVVNAYEEGASADDNAWIVLDPQGKEYESGTGSIEDVMQDFTPKLISEGEERSIIRDATVDYLLDEFGGDNWKIFADTREELEQKIYSELEILNVDEVVDPNMEVGGQRIGNFANGRVIDVVSSGEVIDTVMSQINLDEMKENLRAWFGKGKKGGAGGGGWDRYNTKGERIGKCGDSKKGEGKPKCLSKSKAASLRAKGGKKAIGAAVSKKRRQDPNKNRKGKAKNVSNTKGK